MLMFRDRKKRGQRRKETYAEWGGSGGGGMWAEAFPSATPPQGQTKTPGEVQGDQNRRLNRRWRSRLQSASTALTSSTKTGGKDAIHRTTAPRPPPVGPSTHLLTEPVELPTPQVAHVKQVELKGNAIPQQTPTIRPTSPTTPPCWELAHARIKGRFRDYITPPLDAIDTSHVR